MIVHNVSRNCTKCKLRKLLFYFYKDKTGKGGLTSQCKECKDARDIVYKRTKQGLVGRIHNDQTSGSKSRGHALPTYTRNELQEWCFGQPIFHELYDAWVKSGYNKWLRPSCDRADDYLGYSLDRLQLMTWQKNSDKGRADRRNGINNKNSKAVIQMNTAGAFVKEFHSAKQAERETGVAQQSISLVCHNKRNTCGGFLWKFAVDHER